MSPDKKGLLHGNGRSGVPSGAAPCHSEFINFSLINEWGHQEKPGEAECLRPDTEGPPTSQPMHAKTCYDLTSAVGQGDAADMRALLKKGARPKLLGQSMRPGEGRKGPCFLVIQIPPPWPPAVDPAATSPCEPHRDFSGAQLRF